MSFAGRTAIFQSSGVTQLVWVCLTVMMASMRVVPCYGCGGYVGMGAASTGFIESPNYPGNYPNYTRCIWVFEAPDQYVVNLSVDFVGETFNGQCSDYVEFRDGGQLGDLILTNCATMTSQTVTSTGRWMYVFFHSDGFSQVNGLRATFAASFVGTSLNYSVVDPTKSCRSYEFECSNKICLSLSYRCDGYYDCGCGEGCDEHNCGGLGLSYMEQMMIGLSVGVTVFVMAAIFGLVFEKNHNWEKEVKGSTGSARRKGWGARKAKKLLGTTERTLLTDGLQSSSTRALRLIFHPLLLLLSVSFQAMGHGAYECGGFIKVDHAPKIIRSGAFQTYRRCVWIVQAPDYHRVHLEVSLNHSLAPNSCQSIEVRNWGGSRSTMVSSDCVPLKNTTYMSENRWMYVLFTNQDKTGHSSLSMAVHGVFDGSMKNITNPTVCTAYELKCPNKLCLEFSLRCDGFDDCGIKGDGDDETGCFDRHIGGIYMLVSGIAAGLILTIIVVVSGYLLNKRHNWENVDAIMENWHYVDNSSKPARKMDETEVNEHKPFTSMITTPRITMPKSLLDVHGPDTISVRTAATLTRSLFNVRSKSFIDASTSKETKKSNNGKKTPPENTNQE